MRIVHHLLQKAIEIAERAHAEQTDKAGKPYIGHPIRVMNAGQTLDEKIVGVLHDAVEDISPDWENTRPCCCTSKPRRRNSREFS